MATTKITTPELFDFSATNTALQLPTGTTAQRPTSPSAGEWRFNTTEKYVEYWDGGSPGAWRQIDTEELPNPDDFPSQNFNVNTYFGNGATQTIDAKFNEAANFNGASSGSQIFISDADVFSPANNDLSFSVWVKTSSTSGGYFASKQDDSTVTYEWQFYMNTNGTVVIAVYTSAGSTIATATSTAIVNDGDWHNVAFVIDTNTSITVYVDKAAVTTSSWSATMSNTSTDVLLGAGGGVPSFRLQGMLDQARFFNTAITQSQIDSLYDDETTTTASTLNFPVGAGCFAAYQLDGDASDVGGTYGGVTTDIGYTGLRFQPDLVWVKAREASASHALFDSVRGVNNILGSESTNGESDLSPYGLTSFDTNGFSVSDIASGGNAVNGSAGGTYSGSGAGYVAWCWKGGGSATDITSSSTGVSAASRSANAASGFSIVTYTVNSTSSVVIPHGLNSTPSVALVKRTDSNSDWFFYNTVASGAGRGFLNNSNAFDNSGVPTFDSTNLTFNAQDPFSSGSSAVIYFFADVAGYQKIGSYTGTGASGNNIVTGFEPAFVMWKAAIRPSGGGSWYMYDNKRTTSNPQGQYLQANEPLQELDGTSVFSMDFNSNGFTINATNNEINQSGSTYIFLAIAADARPAPVLANSFSPTLYTGNNTTNVINTVGFKPDLTWVKTRNDSKNHVLVDSVRGVSSLLEADTTAAAATGTDFTSFDTNGFTLAATNAVYMNPSGTNMVSWNWKAAGIPTINTEGSTTSLTNANPASGFSIVKWVGTRPSSDTIGHGLGLTPKMIIIKNLSISSDWTVYAESEGATKHGILDTTTAWVSNNGAFNNTTPTSNVFTVGGDAFTNGLGNNIIAYCFADITGYQKIGSYTGNASSNPISVGFEPRFVMAKPSSATGSWLIMDSARGANEQLYPNLPSAEYSDTGNSFSSTGFTMKSNGNWNASGVTYIYLAIA